MPKITKEDVAYVANLARLAMPEDTEKLVLDMANIVDLADKLSNVKTDGVEPTNHARPLENVFREDICKESYKRDTMLAPAPQVVAGCYAVPDSIDQE
jgi:aspartyl-tRNA(Asn)/glutamyl-tRNA(Gln) amidotransferase subunit C